MSVNGRDVITKARAVLVRGLAVGAVVLGYGFSGIGAQVAAITGISSLAVLGTSQSASAGYSYRGGRRFRRGGYRHRHGY